MLGHVLAGLLAFGMWRVLQYQHGNQDYWSFAQQSSIIFAQLAFLQYNLQFDWAGNDPRYLKHLGELLLHYLAGQNTRYRREPLR